MKREILIGILSLLMLAAVLVAQPQAPAAGAGKDSKDSAVPATRVAVVDFQRAFTENSEGKKAQEKFMGELNRREKEFTDKQKLLADTQNKLQTGAQALSDAAKADLSRQIDKLNTDLQRMNDDAQKELGELQQQLFAPIAQRTQGVLKAYASENGYAMVFDLSSQANSIVYNSEVADITTEIIRRVDADLAKAPAVAPATKAGEPAKKAAEPAKKQ